jgi:hypothetical protein
VGRRASAGDHPHQEDAAQAGKRHYARGGCRTHAAEVRRHLTVAVAAAAFAPQRGEDGLPSELRFSLNPTRLVEVDAGRALAESASQQELDLRQVMSLYLVQDAIVSALPHSAAASRQLGPALSYKCARGCSRIRRRMMRMPCLRSGEREPSRGEPRRAFARITQIRPRLSEYSEADFASNDVTVELPKDDQSPSGACRCSVGVASGPVR